MDRVIDPHHKLKYTWWVQWMISSQKRRFGKPLEPLLYWGRTSRAFLGFLWMLSAFKRKKSPIPKTLQALVRLRISQLLHCPFCIDMNLSEAYQMGLSPEKMEALPHYQTSPLYNEDEKLVLNYAQAVIQSDKQRIPEYQRHLKKIFDDDGIIELTALVSHQAMSALFNSALGIKPHGFCQLKKDSRGDPLAVGTGP